jgi:hypothetical protein
MKVVKHELWSTEKTLSALKHTRLRGFDQPEVYKDSELQLVERVPRLTLHPTQNYVLKPGLQKIKELYSVLMHDACIDIFHLTGLCLFWLEDTPEDAPIPILPPIVEEDTNIQLIWLINDGMHRIYSATDINIILVKNVPTQFPYYAYPLRNGWSNVTQVDKVPESRKAYRNPEDYKALFRDFNALFPGVQKKRT